jgi:hypothetical protein
MRQNETETPVGATRAFVESRFGKPDFVFAEGDATHNYGGSCKQPGEHQATVVSYRYWFRSLLIREMIVFDFDSTDHVMARCFGS